MIDFWCFWGFLPEQYQPRNTLKNPFMHRSKLLGGIFLGVFPEAPPPSGRGRTSVFLPGGGNPSPVDAPPKDVKQKPGQDDLHSDAVAVEFARRVYPPSVCPMKQLIVNHFLSDF